MTARNGSLRITYQRFGSLRIDHSLYRAGQHVDLFAGFTPTRLSTEPCTGAFALSIPGLPGQVGLTAAHCDKAARVPPDRAAINRGFTGAGPGDPPQLGNVLTPPNTRPGGHDAAIFSIFLKWGVTQQIERGDRPPLTVDGWVPTAQQTRGTAVCFAGRTSGADQCGRIVKCSPPTGIKFGPGLICANVTARGGDSGGPVYAPPGHGLSTRALGIVTGHTIRNVTGEILVYTPIEPILGAFGASLPSGPIIRGPIPVAPNGDF